MDIEYLVKNKEELVKLEAAINEFPGGILPQNVKLRVEGGPSDNMVVIVPSDRSSDIEEIRFNPGKIYFRSFRYAGVEGKEIPALTLANENYLYVIELKKRVR